MYTALIDEAPVASSTSNSNNSSVQALHSHSSSSSPLSSLVPLVPADPYGSQRGIVVLDFVRSVGSVRSLPLFVFSLCIFVLLFLVSGLQASCRQLREVDPAVLSPDPCLTEATRKAAIEHYNAVDGWEYWHTTLLHISFFLLFIANSRFNSPLLATLCFLPPLAAQAYMLFYQSADLAWCSLDRIGQLTDQCFDPQRRLLPSIVLDSNDSVCEHWAQAGCEVKTAAEFQYTALVQLSTMVALALLLAFTAWGLVIAAVELYSRHTGRPITSQLFNYRSERQGATCITIHSWIDWMYERYFTSEAEKVENSQLDHSSQLYVLPFHLSLRTYFALSISTLVLTTATVYVILLVAAQQAISSALPVHAAGNSLLAAVLISYVYSIVYMAVHVGAMRAAIKRLLFRLHTAVEHDTLDETLHQLRLRWFSMPFYAGSLLGSVLWTFALLAGFLFIIFFALSSSDIRSAIAPYFWRAMFALLPPVLFVLVYRCCGTFFSFRRCAANPALPLLTQPSHPLCYLCWDCCGLFVGGWGSWVFIVQRLLLAVPIAVSRIDIPTSSFDWVSQQFSAVAVCEAYRIFGVQKEGGAESGGGSSRVNSANLLRSDGQSVLV